MITVSDDIFTLRSNGRMRRGSLFDVIAAVADGSLVDLPAIRAHQRGPVVTALAIIMVALQRYAHDHLSNADDWRQEWNRQLGADALRLVAPHDEPAFLQPPTVSLDNAAELSLAETDVLFQSQAHEAKPPNEGTAEEWVYALMASTWRQFGGRGRYAGARDAPQTVADDS